MELTVGTIITGKVTTITKFGAFVALPGGKSGLVHISEVSGSFVTDVHDFLTEGQEVPVKVLSISPEGKISLSVKQAQPPKPRTMKELAAAQDAGGLGGQLHQAFQRIGRFALAVGLQRFADCDQR